MMIARDLRPQRARRSARHLGIAVLAALVLWLLSSHVAAAPSRAVAVLYDDSGSMTQPRTRWIGANLSLQIMASLLNQGDVLLLSKMNAQPLARRYEVPGGIDALLTDLQSEPTPNGNTPYAGIDELLRLLKDSPATEKWLLVVTDGEFNGFTEESAQRQIDTIVKPLGIRVAFLLIEHGKFDAARYWQKAAGATVVQADNGSEVPLRMEEIATMLTGRDANGVQVTHDGNDLLISSRFPLRGVVALMQGDSDILVSEALAGQTAMTVRSHKARVRMRTPGIPQGANIAHVFSPNGIAAGEKIVRIKLSGPSSGNRIKIYPEVAARMEVAVLGADGKALLRDSQGFFRYCQGEEVDLQTRLIGPGDLSITVGRNDVPTFEVGFAQDAGTVTRSSIDAKQERFAVRIKPSANQRLLPFARYPGYFSYVGEPLNLRAIACKREVAVTLESRLSPDGLWTQRVDRLATTPPLVFAISIDGSPATDVVLKDWRWQTDSLKDWDLRVENGKLYLSGRAGCCAMTWSRPKAHRGSLQLMTLSTGNARDVIRLPAPVSYEWTLPDRMQDRMWWLFGCPIAALFLLLATMLYLWVLFIKERFGRRAAVHVLRRRTDTKVPFCRTKDLPKRWLWPSRRETKVIEGLKFIAVGRGGHAVLVDGKSLTSKYEIDTWQFDEQLQDLKRPQRDARLKDQSIIARRPSGGYRAEDVDLRMQYAQRGQPSNWSQ